MLERTTRNIIPYTNKIKQHIDAKEIIGPLIIDLFRKNKAIRSDLCVFSSLDNPSGNNINTDGKTFLVQCLYFVLGPGSLNLKSILHFHFMLANLVYINFN